MWCALSCVVCESYSTDPSGIALIADLWVPGIWQPQADVLFDVGVVDTDTPSYCGHSPEAVLWIALNNYIPLNFNHQLLKKAISDYIYCQI